MRQMIQTLITGALSYTPLNKLMFRTTGTISARYCYSVWLRHLSVAFEHGVNTIPGVIAELGPGDSLGIGIAGLLSGANAYMGLDLIPYVTPEKNLTVLQDLIDLFSNYTDIPDENEFPQLKPYLKNYGFPFHILSRDHLKKCLVPSRIKQIENAIVNQKFSDHGGATLSIQYHAPWFHTDVVQKSSVDMIFSQAVLEHVNDIDQTYRFLNLWLKPGGHMSHQIDFRSHGASKIWNGHLAYNDRVWRIMKGNRPYFINRKLFTEHVDMHGKYGFKILSEKSITNKSGITRDKLDRSFQHVTDKDLVTSGTHLLSQKST